MKNEVFISTVFGDICPASLEAHQVRQETVQVLKPDIFREPQNSLRVRHFGLKVDYYLGNELTTEVLWLKVGYDVENDGEKWGIGGGCWAKRRRLIWAW